MTLDDWLRWLQRLWLWPKREALATAEQAEWMALLKGLTPAQRQEVIQQMRAMLEAAEKTAGREEHG